MGPRDRAGELRRVLQLLARRQLRRRPDQRVHPEGEHLGLQGPATAGGRHADRDRRPLGDRLRERQRGGAHQHAVLPRGALAGAARPPRVDHGRLNDRPGARGPPPEASPNSHATSRPGAAAGRGSYPREPRDAVGALRPASA